MMLMVGGADGWNCYSRNLWISGIGDPVNIDIRYEGIKMELWFNVEQLTMHLW